MNRQLGAVALLNPSELGRTEADIVFNDGKLHLFLAYVYELNPARSMGE